MTRFARAKGSKSSNEKKPEEATSWLEMKNSILSKKASQIEKPVEKVEVEVEAPRKTEWASLGDNGPTESPSLLKPNLGKKNKNKNLGGNEGGQAKMKKKKISGNLENGVNSHVDEGSDKKSKKKLKKTVSEVSDINKNKVKKKDKKRKLDTNGETENSQPKKKKKSLQTEDSGSKLNKKEKLGNSEGNRKSPKTKQTTKSKYFRNGSEGRNFKSRNDRRQFDKHKGKQKFNNKSFEGNSAVEELIINGEKIKIVKFQGFYVTLDDAERLKKLRGEMIKQGIPKGKLEAAIKLERRRAEKALSRLKKSVCFHCRERGHLLSSCPNLTEKENTGTGICYKCGSTEHSATECKVVRGTDFKFAECFICKEQGHIARQCPDNPRGLYPQGGACRECGDVTHLRKDCPQVQAQKAEEVVTVGLRNDRNLECLDEEIASREKRNSEKKVKKNPTVRF